MASLTSRLALGTLLPPFPKAGTTGRPPHPGIIYLGSGEPKLWSLFKNYIVSLAEDEF